MKIQADMTLPFRIVDMIQGHLNRIHCDALRLSAASDFDPQFDMTLSGQGPGAFSAAEKEESLYGKGTRIFEKPRARVFYI